MAQLRGHVVSKGILLESSPQSGLQAQAQEEFVMPFAPGEVLCGKYEVSELLGAGGMGFVVSAIHLELGEKVALKFLRPESLANQELVGRFAREARAAVRIKSEYVARVFDVGSLPDGAPFIVMEYLEGKDLGDVLREQGPLPVKQAVEYMMQACEALAVAHVAGVVHRDVKPENIFLVQQAQGMDSIKVLDFGISKVALTGSVHDTKLPAIKTMMPMGSPVYMSPEQIRAKRDIDARTDIWSLGCTLYELLAGVAAFDAPSLTQITAAILEDQPPSLQSLCSLVPAELEAVVSHCIEKDPAKRFQNVGELAVALYPFGPRRARISAERCSYVLKQAGVLQHDFELPSVMPPRSATGIAIGSIASMNAVTIDPTPNPRPPSLAAPLISVAPARTGGAWKGAAVAGGVMTLLLLAYALLGRRDTSAAVAAGAARAAPVAVAATPSPLPAVVPPPQVIELSTAAPPPPAPPIAPVRNPPSAPGPGARPRSVGAPPRSRAPAAQQPEKPPSSASHELDVGF
jgi:serine/threonine protein kinase